jgi:four helix bundle protein
MSKSDEMRLRTRRFAGEVVRFFVTLDRKREELRVLGKQLLRAGTSVGANYREASRARSDSEFVAKIELCTQEADETQYWLELLKDDCGLRSEDLERIWSEADELIRIFVTMSKKHESENENPRLKPECET